MLQYQVMQLDTASYRGGETITIKGIFDSFGEADEYAERLYNDSIDYNKSDANYDSVESGCYEEFQQADGGGQELLSKYVVVEVEFEMNMPTEIEL